MIRGLALNQVQGIGQGLVGDDGDDLRPALQRFGEQLRLRPAEPVAMSPWQTLEDHLAVIAAIGAIAAQFGCRIARFPLIEEYTLADNFRLDDRAIFCCDGNLEADSRPFGRPDSGHRNSPWFRAPLRLHSVNSARDRYRAWAAVEWERIHASPPTQWLGDDGQMHEQPRPTNPYKAEASVK
jgi:hypothetical protein